MRDIFVVKDTLYVINNTTILREHAGSTRPTYKQLEEAENGRRKEIFADEA